MRMRGRLKLAEVNFPWTYKWHDSGFDSIWHQKIRGHDDEAKSRWEVKRDHPNPRRQVKNEMRCPQPDTNANKCHVQERHTADTTMMLVPFSPPFMVSTSLFLYKLEEDTICLLYKSNLVHLTSPRKEELEYRHYDWIQCHQGLTSLTKEELGVFSCLESLKR